MDKAEKFALLQGMPLLLNDSAVDSFAHMPNCFRCRQTSVCLLVSASSIRVSGQDKRGAVSTKKSQRTHRNNSAQHVFLLLSRTVKRLLARKKGEQRGVHRDDVMHRARTLLPDGCTLQTDKPYGLNPA